MLDRKAEMNRLLQEIRAGSEEAAEQFVRRFGETILRVIRGRLEPRLRSQFDSCDFLQDVFTSFFAAPPAPEVFSGPDALLEYLTTMARHKVVDVARQHLFGKRRNLNRETSLDGSSKFKAMEQAGGGPTPSEVVMADERLEGLTQGMPPGHQRIVQLRRLGYTHSEIAAELGLSTRQVQLRIRHLDRKQRS